MSLFKLKYHVSRNIWTLWIVKIAKGKIQHSFIFYYSHNMFAGNETMGRARGGGSWRGSYKGRALPPPPGLGGNLLTNNKNGKYFEGVMGEKEKREKGKKRREKAE